MTRRKFPQEFKDQAVNLTYTSPQSGQQIADDLGIAANKLHRWPGARAVVLALAADWAEGEHMTLDQAVAYALQGGEAE